ncbi:WAT1-related protein At5g47470-like [Carex rostrata]
MTCQHCSHHGSTASSFGPNDKKEWDDAIIIIGLVAVQIVNAAFMVFVAPLLSQGLNPLFLVCFGSLTTAVFILPFAILFERKKWPSRLKPALMVKFIFLALGGVAFFQVLMMIGMKKTSPSIAVALPNLAPGIIFIIAVSFRFEKADLMCFYTRAKVLGTLLCLSGAIAISFLQIPSNPMLHKSDSPQIDSHSDWIFGCLCLLAAVLVVSCTTVLQAETMTHFAAPSTLCSVTSFIGAGFTALFQVVMEGKIDMGSPSIKPSSVASFILVGSVTGSICIAFNTWAVKKKGPVMVSMFSPISTVGSAILSAIYLHQIFKFGSIIGMILLSCGLYIVLWAKKKEGVVPATTNEEVSTRNVDAERPLLN